MLTTYISRRKKTGETEITINEDGECCGAHEVCDRESLLSADANAEYFDDENLDVLADVQPDKFTEDQLNQLSEVFYTLRESDVAAWLRSLQIRRIPSTSTAWSWIPSSACRRRNAPPCRP